MLGKGSCYGIGSQSLNSGWHGHKNTGGEKRLFSPPVPYKVRCSILLPQFIHSSLSAAL